MQTVKEVGNEITVISRAGRGYKPRGANGSKANGELPLDG